jgi:hypothetical protein
MMYWKYSKNIFEKIVKKHKFKRFNVVIIKVVGSIWTNGESYWSNLQCQTNFKGANKSYLKTHQLKDERIERMLTWKSPRENLNPYLIIVSSSTMNMVKTHPRDVRLLRCS